MNTAVSKTNPKPVVPARKAARAITHPPSSVAKSLAS